MIGTERVAMAAHAEKEQPSPFLTPKLEPKLEPADPLPSPSPARATPKTLTLIPPSPIFSPLFTLSPNIVDENRRLTNLILSLSAHKRLNSNPSSSIIPSTLKKMRRSSRSSDLQRVANISVEEAVRIRAAVRRTRILYESLRTRLLQEEDASPPAAGKRSRVDLNAGTLMSYKGLWLNREKRTVGFIPGVHIGDVFLYRMELCVIGLHGHIQAGIDFVPASQTDSGEPIATSIIVSGNYEDDVDHGDVLVYTGHGGREGKNETKHSLDQRLEGGNLALERSHHYDIEIRVIRGFDCMGSPSGRVYVYDGLYNVVSCWSERGKSGFNVYKFKLRRIEGQEEMGSSVIRFAEELKIDPLRMRPKGYLSLDVSKGKEKVPVAVFNDIDDDSSPLQFEYLVRPVFKSFVVKGNRGSGCLCDSDCSFGCKCTERNGGEVYDSNGRLLRGKPVVYECGRHCRCSSSCVNRRSQKGMTHRLEIFRREETHWSVRSMDFIWAGEFVCEFSGFLLTKQEAELMPENGTRLVCPNKFPRRWEEWGDLSLVRSDYKKPVTPPLPEIGYSIDISRVRNVACYLSHSCNPNVFLQPVLVDHCNAAFPRLMVFAMENIPPMRELSLDYGGFG